MLPSFVSLAAAAMPVVAVAMFVVAVAFSSCFGLNCSLKDCSSKLSIMRYQLSEEGSFLLISAHSATKWLEVDLNFDVVSQS